jgi:hypothetical protein
VIDMHTATAALPACRMWRITPVCRRLPQVGFHGWLSSPKDMPPETRRLYELRAIWQNSSNTFKLKAYYTDAKPHAAVGRLTHGGRR